MKQFNLDEYVKNPSRKVVTRWGNPVKILCTNYHRDEYPVVAEIYFTSLGIAKSYSFTENGRKIIGETNIDDLFFEAEKHFGWVNIYKDDEGKFSGAYIYPSKEEAINSGKPIGAYVTTTKIEWED